MVLVAICNAGGVNALNPPPGGSEDPTRVSPCDATSAPDDGFSTLVAISSHAGKIARIFKPV